VFDHLRGRLRLRDPALELREVAAQQVGLPVAQHVRRQAESRCQFTDGELGCLHITMSPAHTGRRQTERTRI
jgi:hypothetical protein